MGDKADKEKTGSKRQKVQPSAGQGSSGDEKKDEVNVAQDSTSEEHIQSVQDQLNATQEQLKVSQEALQDALQQVKQLQDQLQTNQSDVTSNINTVQQQNQRLECSVAFLTDEVSEKKDTIRDLMILIQSLEASLGRASLTSNLASDQSIAYKTQLELNEQRQSQLTILVDCLMKQIGTLRDWLLVLTDTDSKLIPNHLFQVSLMRAFIPNESNMDKTFHEIRLLSIHLDTVLRYCKIGSMLTQYMRNTLESQTQGLVDYSRSEQQRKLLTDVIRLLDEISTIAVTKSKTLTHENRPQFVFALAMHKDDILDLMKLCSTTLTSPAKGIEIWPTFCTVNHKIFMSAPTASEITSAIPTSQATSSPQPTALAPSFKLPSPATQSPSTQPPLSSTSMPVLPPTATSSTSSSNQSAQYYMTSPTAPSQPSLVRYPDNVSAAPDVHFLFNTVQTVQSPSSYDTYAQLSQQRSTSTSSSSSSSSSPIRPNTFNPTPQQFQSPIRTIQSPTTTTLPAQRYSSSSTLPSTFTPTKP